MLRYLIRRVLLFVPTMLVISLFTFGLSKCAPYDPVAAVLGDDMVSGLDPEALAREYSRKAKQLKIDKPAFYGTLTTQIFPIHCTKCTHLSDGNACTNLPRVRVTGTTFVNTIMP
ncbi:MAG: hypothetical protein IPL65_02660 [Lewinellaceae bacterium]|nr:hypothetical protein [Lewinellaceae bacterium]